MNAVQLVQPCGDVLRDAQNPRIRRAYFDGFATAKRIYTRWHDHHLGDPIPASWYAEARALTGYVLVPAEMTSKMLRAAAGRAPREFWRAAIDAVPYSCDRYAASADRTSDACASCGAAWLSHWKRQ